MKIESFDQVLVSGYEPFLGRFFYKLKGVVGSAEPTQIKVWPNGFDGKLWFSRHHSRITVTKKWWA